MLLDDQVRFCPQCGHARHLDHDCVRCTCAENSQEARYLRVERTPDGHPQVWLLYRPEPFAPGSDDDRSIHLWVRRADVFTSRDAAAAHLSALLGWLVSFEPYDELFPELSIYRDHRGYRWLLCPAPVDPPGGQR